jgi:hypothetical protein
MAGNGEGGGIWELATLSLIHLHSSLRKGSRPRLRRTGERSEAER